MRNLILKEKVKVVVAGEALEYEAKNERTGEISRGVYYENSVIIPSFDKQVIRVNSNFELKEGTFDYYIRVEGKASGQMTTLKLRLRKEDQEEAK